MKVSVKRYELSKPKDILKLTNEIKTEVDLFGDEDFKEFIAEKCFSFLKDLCDIQNDAIYTDEHSIFDAKVREYGQSHKKIIGRKYVEIYNSTKLAQSEMWWVSEKTRANYPNGISIAKIIEYGTGIKGTSVKGWKTNVNNYGGRYMDIYTKTYKNGAEVYHAEYNTRRNEWVYYNPDNWGSSDKTESLKFTSGLEGRFVYQKLYDYVLKNFDSWVKKYLSSKGE